VVSNGFVKANPSFADIDKDGDLDAFVGLSNGTIQFYQNDGSGVFSPANGTTIINPFAGLYFKPYGTAPSLVDIDGDEDIDLFVGSANGSRLEFYQNDGTGIFLPSDGVNIKNPLADFSFNSSYLSPDFVDIDKDGDLDALIGENGDVAIVTNSEFTSGSAARPDIKVNGQDTPLVIAQGATLTVTAGLSAGNMVGRNADWWIYANAPSGKYWYQNGQWVLSTSPLRTYAIPLSHYATRTILNSSRLPAGAYTIRFAVDNNMDGIMDQTYLDFVDVTIQ